MPFLVIDTLEVPVSTESVAENTAHELGVADYAMDGQGLSSIEGRKRSWSVRTPPLTEEAIADLEDAAAPGSFAPCSGYLFGPEVDQPLDCLVEWVGEEHESIVGGEHLRSINLLLSEA